MDSDSPLSDREILLGLRPQDWEFLHGREKPLSKQWARELQVHPKTIVFNERFPTFLTAKVAHASPSTPMTLIATLKQTLHLDEARAHDAASFRATLPERIRQILDLPTERFPDPDYFAHGCSSRAENSGEDGNPARKTAEPSAHPLPMGVQSQDDLGANHAVKHSNQHEVLLDATVDALELIRDTVIEHAETLRNDSIAGKRPSQETTDVLSEWHGMWSKVPEQATTLTEARALVDREARRAQKVTEDRRLVASVTSLKFPKGNEQALASIASVQAEVAEWPLPLDEGSHADLVALLTVLWNGLSSDDSLLRTVGDRFGHQALIAASMLMPAVEGTVESDATPAVTVSVETSEPAATPEVDGAAPAMTVVGGGGPETRTVAGSDGSHSSASAHSEAESQQPRRGTGAYEPPESRSKQAEPELRESVASEPTEPEQLSETSTYRIHANTAKHPDPVIAPAPVEVVVDATVPEDFLPRFEEAAAREDFGLAYWYAVAGRDEILSQAAHLLVIATSSDMVEGSPHPLADTIAARLGGDLGEVSAAVHVAVAAALVPAALLMPPYSEATLSLNAIASRLGSDCPTFIRIANTLTYERGSGLYTVEAPLLLAARDQARADLEQFRDRAPSRTIRFRRATEVWRELIRQQGLLGSLAARALDYPVDAGLREELTAIDGRAIERIIKNTDQQLKPMQAKRQAIVAGAKQELASSIQRYVDLLRAFVAAEESVRAIDRGTSHNTDLIEELIGALSAAPVPDVEFGGVIKGVASWLQERLASHGNTHEAVPERDALTQPLVKSYELERDANGEFDSAEVTVALLDAAQTRTAEDAFNGYVAQHDYVGVALLLDTVRTATPRAVSGLEERERRAKTESREAFRRALEHTRVGLSRALAATSLSDTEAQDYLDQVERVSRDTDPHFRETLATLARIDDELAARHGKRLYDAEVRLAGLTEVDDASRKRVADLIAARDLLSAEEFLAQLINGAKSLPEEAAQDRTLEEFWTVAEDAAASGPGVDWFAERLRAGKIGKRPLPHSSAPQRILDGLLAWERLNQQARRQGWDRLLLDVLSAVGFRQVKLGQRFTPGRASTSNLFEAQYDGYALTPTFGSTARGRYAIYLCWERKTVDGLLQSVSAVQEAQSRPTVVLYFHTLKTVDRRQLAEQCRRKGLPHIVIDPAAMAYLGTREEARLDGLMRTCQPFSGANPYTPFVLGDVPREMFYGRRDELRAVQDPNGPLFVYGGRQLGKSALLKTATSEFDRIDEHHVSIYLDLKAEGIGEWHRADDLWRALLPHLLTSGVAGQKVSRQAPPEVIVRQITEWLAEDPRRHLLLLLDESDAFLDQDSQPRNAGKGQFKNVYMLKNLMNQSQRRFKPVFAGLHQVQRFHKESNGPMAHVGTEIPVGPLQPAEAYKLVVRPMEAIGYRFESPDVVWRLLSHTNYHASLIQLFCQALVNDLKPRRLPLTEPPSPIDAATVDRVYENKQLRSQIVQRFDWTIQLDNRYRVIALVAAWMNLTDAETVVPISELRSQCSDFWPVGFDGVSPDEFRALLDEMVGLGVLVRNQADCYGIRSPNVIRLLGSKDEIERKLMDSVSLELPTVFDPARYRRRLANHSRSPLTEAQAARMLSNASEPTLIVASRALGADRLIAALTEIAGSGEGVQLFPTTPSELTSTLTTVLRMRRPRHIFLDARGIDQHELRAALTRLGKAARTQSTFSASVLLNPSDRIRLGRPDIGVREVTTQPWTDAELCAVEPEADVPLDADVRTELLHVTGGWPEVLEPVLAHRRTDVTAILRHANLEANKVNDRGWDAFATHLGVPRGGLEELVLTTLLDWGEPIGRIDLANLLAKQDAQQLTDALEALVLSGAAENVGGQPGSVFRVNPLVARTMEQSL